MKDLWQEESTRQTHDYQQAEHREILNLVLMMASHYSELPLIHGVRSSCRTATPLDTATDLPNLFTP